MTEDEIPIGQLAEDYLSALESEADDNELEEARDRLSKLQERHNRFKSDYGESDPTTQELAERVSESEEQIKHLEEAQEVPEELEEQFLEAATGFTFSEEWLEPGVLEALNQALVGERNSVLVVEEFEITGINDVTDVEDITRFDIIDIVRKLAMDKLGGTEDVGDVWDSIAGTTKERPFRIIADLGDGTPDDVMERVDEEDLDRETVRNRLKNATTLAINPYYRENGTYSLATPGKYLAREYAKVEAVCPEEPVETPEQGDQSQQTLNQPDGALGGNTNE